MYKPQRESCVIQIKGGEGQARVSPTRSKLTNLSPMKILDRLRKILMRFILSSPSRSASSNVGGYRQRHGDHPEPPKTSCSSYNYSPNSHYNEAIADCIEFFNKSSQEGTWTAGRKSDVIV